MAEGDVQSPQKGTFTNPWRVNRPWLGMIYTTYADLGAGLLLF